MSFALRPARSALAFSVAATLSLSALFVAPHSANAAAWHVQNCDDSGPGSLRDTLFHLPDGDVADLTALACSTITLTSGPLVLSKPSAKLKGPGFNLMSISADHHSRVIESSRVGILTIEGLTLRDGTFQTTTSGAGGGCVSSKGDVALQSAAITGCQAIADTGGASGGALWVQGALQMTDSSVTDSAAHSNGASATGGGIFVSGPLFITRSTVASNEVSSYEPSWGGGVVGTWDVSIVASTLSDNRADYAAALFMEGPSGTKTLTNTTIAHNVAAITISAFRTDGPVTINNSTIARNRSSTQPALVENGAVLLNNHATVATLNSSIIAVNTTFEGALLTDIVGNGSISKKSLNNMIRLSALPIPAGTIVDCPRLGNLATNGGPTETMALLRGSPAIDAGNNAAALPSDQRGQPRASGAKADIGAYEFQGNGGTPPVSYGPPPPCT